MKSVGMAIGLLALLVLGWRAAEWMGVALVLGGAMMWLLLHFTRLMIVLQRAARRPIGHVDSAVMLNAALKRGLSLVQVLAHTRALGAQDSPKGEQPEVFVWTDGSGAQVFCSFTKGKLTQWTLVRPGDAAPSTRDPDESTPPAP